VLGEPNEQEMAALCYEAGADAYVCLHTATTRALLWIVARAIERVRLLAENRRLEQVKRRQLQSEHLFGIRPCREAGQFRTAARHTV
jgi:hypothetical protein